MGFYVMFFQFLMNIQTPRCWLEAKRAYLLRLSPFFTLVVPVFMFYYLRLALSASLLRAVFLRLGRRLRAFPRRKVLRFLVLADASSLLLSFAD